MQAIILAAGLAKRLRPLTDTTPKCLLDLGGVNLLHRAMDNIIRNGIKDFIFVTGYRESMIKDYLNTYFRGVNIEFLTNGDYMNNNNSYSLWMTKSLVREDVILLDSDILFDARIIGKLLSDKHENSVAVNITPHLDAEQIKVTVDAENRILEIGKEVKISEAVGESIGIEKFSKRFMDEIFKVLDRKILKENNVNEFYERTFEEIISRESSAYDGNSLYCVDVSVYECMEIDTVEDYNNAVKSMLNYQLKNT